MSIERVEQLPRDPACAPWCTGGHSERWNAPECMTNLIPHNLGDGPDRLGLFVKRQPGGTPYAEVWTTASKGTWHVIPLSAETLDELLGQLLVAAGMLEAAEVAS